MKRQFSTTDLFNIPTVSAPAEIRTIYFIKYNLSSSNFYKYFPLNDSDSCVTYPILILMWVYTHIGLIARLK